MKRIKDIALYSALCFTFVMLLICALYGVAESSQTDEARVLSAEVFANNAFTVFVFSVGVGLSFLLFDLKPLGKTVKRVLHVAVTYGMSVACIITVLGNNSQGSQKLDVAMLVFAGTFIFLAVYFAAMLISFGINKLGTAIDSRNN